MKGYILKTAKWQEYESVWEHSKASGNDLLLLLTLVKFRQSKTFVTKETLAAKMRCSVDTVDRSLKRLKMLGELEWDKGSAKAQKANNYRILLPGLDADFTAISTAVSTANSSSIPPQTHGEYPRNITPPNISKQKLNIYIENMMFESDEFRVLTQQVAEGLGLSAIEVHGMFDAFISHPSFRLAVSDFDKCKRWFDWLQNPRSRQRFTSSNKNIVDEAEGK